MPRQPPAATSHSCSHVSREQQQPHTPPGGILARPTGLCANSRRSAGFAQPWGPRIRTYGHLRYFSTKLPIVVIGTRFPTVPPVGKRATGVLVAGILVIGACSGGSATTSAPTTKPGSAGAPGSTVAPTTTTTMPEFSFDDSVPPPELINTGTDYVAILKSLESYGNWLAAHRPDRSSGRRGSSPAEPNFFGRTWTSSRSSARRINASLTG